MRAADEANSSRGKRGLVVTEERAGAGQGNREVVRRHQLAEIALNQWRGGGLFIDC